MKKKTNILLIALFVVLLSSIALAQQNKVVVVPLSMEKPAIGGFSSQNGVIYLDESDQLISQVSLDVPTKGFVIVNTSGYFDWLAASDQRFLIQCSITQGTVLDEGYQFTAGSFTADMGVEYMPFGATGAFAVTPGTYALTSSAA